MRGLSSAVAVALALVGAPPQARAQMAECAPACLPGETCVGGTCMIPAQRAPEPPGPQPPAAPEAEAPAPEAGQPEPAAAPQPAPVIVAPAPPPRVHTTPRPRATEAIAPRLRHGRVYIPFVGVHSIQNEDSSGTDPGLRLGALAGAFVNNDISLNGAITFDLLNPNDSIAPLDLRKEAVELTFSPLYHLGSPRVEFIVGPKVGLWQMWTQYSEPAPAAQSGHGTSQGWTLGGNMGLLVAVSPKALAGVLFNLELRDVIHVCGTAAGQAERCSWSGPSSTLLGISFAVLL